MRLKLLPTGHIHDRKTRPVRDLLRRRLRLVRQRTLRILSFKSLNERTLGQRVSLARVKAMKSEEAQARFTEPADPLLDLRTFRLGVMGFGTNLVDVPADRVFYQTQVNVTNDLGVVVEIVARLDLAQGKVTWEFTSLDPATGDLPWDPYIGFLPRNTNGIIGQGFVTYTIKPKAGIAHGDIINAEARIFFDYNEPMDTPHIFNTVDASLPTSTVLPLAATTNRNVFLVRWAGADAYGGSGIRGFDVHVSNNGGPWQLWLQNSPYWERLFVSECGHRYDFRSVARDNVGHQEAALSASQAAIAVLPNTPPVLAVITNRVIAVGSYLSFTNSAADADSPAQGLTYSLDPGAPAGMSIDPVQGGLSWSPTCGQGNSSNRVTVRVTDDRCGSLSAAQQFAVVVTECLQTSLGQAVSLVGGSACVPIYLESSDGVTNLTFTVVVPPGRFTSFTVNPVAPEVGGAGIISQSASNAVMTVTAQPGQAMRGPVQLAELCFTLLPAQDSAFVRLEIANILATKTNGVPVGNTTGNSGRTVAIGRQPLLEMVTGPAQAPLLLLYGNPGKTYGVESKTNLLAGTAWLPAWDLTLTNLVQGLEPQNPDAPAMFYRAFEHPLAAPVLKIQRVAGGVFSLSLEGMPGQTYTLQTAGRLGAGVTWTPVSTFTLTNAASAVFWTNQGDAARFFRAVKN